MGYNISLHSGEDGANWGVTPDLKEEWEFVLSCTSDRHGKYQWQVWGLTEAMLTGIEAGRLDGTPSANNHQQYICLRRRWCRTLWQTLSIAVIALLACSACTLFSLLLSLTFLSCFSFLSFSLSLFFKHWQRTFVNRLWYWLSHCQRLCNYSVNDCSRSSVLVSRQERRENLLLSELTLCADTYSVSVPPPCYRSGT